ncbi:uncharacterized protein LOC132706587 [Cylas formicarius]|uniref:uncharacterized protein LOC132706587 n=1 Tax=Cylas formicarius TaxID=197179 RepID=UPI0029586127|nr:uncharacterized protein LOC132706587 [Cylas formicarius]
MLIHFLMVAFVVTESKMAAETNTSFVYIPPGNTRFPYGDEATFNINFADKDVNQVTCYEKIKVFSEKGSCPFTPEESEEDLHPYVDCPEFTHLPPLSNLVYTDKSFPTESQCDNCDLRVTEDETAVILKCTGCFDLTVPSQNQTDIVYKVFYVGIANYSSGGVKGAANV